MKRTVTAFLTLAALLTALTACGGSGPVSYADGTYEGTSSVLELLDPDNEDGIDGYGIVTLTIQDNAITDCTYLTYQADGTLKDENYGKSANQDYYNKAQRCVLACEDYARQLVEKGDAEKVDAVSGATISYNQFKEAVQDALKQAKQ